MPSKIEIHNMENRQKCPCCGNMARVHTSDDGTSCFVAEDRLTPLDVDNLRCFLDGWGLNKTADLAKALCRQFGVAHDEQTDRLADALESLYVLQNGPVLIRESEQWESAMGKAKAALAAYRGEEGE